ncbi:hypothetical protein LEP1GSC068_0073 [Leptospira sp. Fiocruz LV3954]|nr:hypothetical protein LEP1GSC068_0073 [Leptospira sp. Fiocruz LV3954]EMI61365.1 hypothetical protein LEP1GSC076_0122 [Leptospira sp. Fiocruz LV4135]
MNFHRWNTGSFRLPGSILSDQERIWKIENFNELEKHTPFFRG